MSENRPPTFVILKEDQTGQDLPNQVLRVLAPEVIRFDPALAPFDLSLETRRARHNDVDRQAAEAIRSHGFGLKAATIASAAADVVGSPNAFFREAVGAKVILRTGRRLPSIHSVEGVHAPISDVRMAARRRPPSLPMRMFGACALSSMPGILWPDGGKLWLSHPLALTRQMPR